MNMQKERERYGIYKKDVKIKSFNDYGRKERLLLTCLSRKKKEGKYCDGTYYTTGRVIKTKDYGEIIEIKCNKCGDKRYVKEKEGNKPSWTIIKEW